MVLESIKFRRSLFERRRGPKWFEENELRRMEHQFRKVMSKLEKNPQKGRPELARFSKELKQIMSDYGNTEAKLPHYTFPARRMLRSFAIGHTLGGIEK